MNPADDGDREVPVMTARSGRTGNGPRARAVALAVTLSLGLHVLVWWGFGRLRQEGGEPPGGPTLCDTRLFLDLSPGRVSPKKGAEEEQGFQVQVAAPSPPPGGDRGTAPVVRLHGQGGGSPHGTAAVGNGPAKFFEMPVRCRRVVFVVDRSLSMANHGALTLARRELLACLRSLSPDALFQVVLYNVTAEPMPGGMLAVSYVNLRRVEEVLARTHPSGGTDHVAALRCAFALRPEAVFLVTDADDLTAEQQRLITAINRDHIVIHTINVGQRPTAGGMLEELARATGGRHISFTAPR